MRIAKNIRERMSLRKYCFSCGAKCCKGKTLVSEKEQREICAFSENTVFVHEESHFYIVRGPCPFLRSARCSIQQWKPFVCIIFPFIPVTIGHRIRLYLVRECPAATFINWDFIHRAKQLTMRFFSEFPLGEYAEYWQKHKTSDFELNNALAKIDIDL